MRRDLRRTFLMPALLALLAFVTAPLFGATALAADATLYELTENMKLVGKDSPRRKATSELMGTADAGTPLCPLPVGAPPCTINATGSDKISLATGLGDFSGRFTAVVQGDNATDSPEFVIAKGKFKGKMDFSPAILWGIPMGTVVGHVVRDGSHTRHPFTGTFRLPFVLPYPDAWLATLYGWGPLPLTPFPMKLYPGQKDADGNTLCPTGDTQSCSRPLYLGDNWYPFDVVAEEYGLGYPTVRFEINFAQ